MGLSRWIRVWQLLPLFVATLLAGDRTKAGGVDVMASDKLESVAPIVEGNTQFAFDLYGRLRAGTGNCFISPYSISTANLSTWLGKTSQSNVAVEFPRFTVTETLWLARVLREMGMPLAFGAGADLSGMNGQRNLAFSEVIHKAFVDVNEKGTEAAAATAVIMSTLSAGRPPKIIPFQADHPFVFLIRDRATSSILFLGRLVEPKG